MNTTTTINDQNAVANRTHASPPLSHHPSAAPATRSSPSHKPKDSSTSLTQAQTQAAPTPASPGSMAIDMKRLLSKPAPPFARHGPGSGSESEGTHSVTSGGSLGRKKADRERRHRDREWRMALREVGMLDHPAPDLSLGSAELGRTLSVRSRTTSEGQLDRERERKRESSRERERDSKDGRDKDKRTRNVLRRRPSQTQMKSLPAPPVTTATATGTISAPKSISHSNSSGTATPTSTLTQTLTPPMYSLLPPLSPRSPLTPSILPMGSPRERPGTAPSSPGLNMKEVGRVGPGMGRSVSLGAPAVSGSITMKEKQGKRLPVPPQRLPVAPAVPPPTEHKCIVNVTDTDSSYSLNHHPPRNRLPTTSSSRTSSKHSTSPAPSRRPSPGPRDARSSPLACHSHENPRHLSSSTIAKSSSTSRSSSPRPPMSISPAAASHGHVSPPSTVAMGSAEHGTSSGGLSPAAAVVAAYKRLAKEREASSPSSSPLTLSPNTKEASPARHTVGGSKSFSASESGLSTRMRMSLDGSVLLGGGGEGFGVIERTHVQLRDQHQKDAKRPHTSGAMTPRAHNASARKEHIAMVEKDEDGAHQPYYTVFGADAGRVVDVDHLAWDVHAATQPFGASGPVKNQPSGSGMVAVTGGLRTLSRKVSGRWRRGAGASEGDKDIGSKERNLPRRGASMSVERERDRDRGRPSLQAERRVPSTTSTSRSGKRMTVGAIASGGTVVAVGEGDRRSLRLSIDKFPVGEEVRMLRRGGNSTHREREREKEKEKISPSTPSPSPSPGGGGSRIWKLMKRISTGGLREKFGGYERDMDAPPVPALPKAYSSSAGSSPHAPVHPDRDPEATPRRGMGQSTSPSGGGFGFKGLKRKGSLLLGTGTTSAASSPVINKVNVGAHTSPRSPLGALSPSPATRPPPPSVAAGRPSTATQSSSPNSSDVASTKFFSSPYKHSASIHSSETSLPFEDVTAPPVPTLGKPAGVGQYIIPPSELGRIYTTSDDGHSLGHSSFTGSGSHESSSLQSHYRTTSQRTRTNSQAQNALRKLKVVVPPSVIAQPSPKLPRKSEDYVIVHTPADELASLPLPPRKVGKLQSRVRSDSNTPTPGGSWGGGWGGSEETDAIAGEEEKREWDRMWGGGGLDGGSSGNVQLDSRSGSPIMPSFSTAEAVNTFTSKRSSVDMRRSAKPSSSSASATSPMDLGSAVTISSSGLNYHPQRLKDLQDLPGLGQSPSRSPMDDKIPPAPPRPSRSTQRPPPPVGSNSTPTSPHDPNKPSQQLNPVPVPGYSGTSAASSPVIVNPNRRSTGGHSTTSTATVTKATHLRRRSGSYLSISNSPPSSPPRRAMTFRELGHPGPGAVLTEQEKAARWEDLLERSAQAGGTLHLDIAGRSGEHGLKSDRLRFSEISEVASM